MVAGAGTHGGVTPDFAVAGIIRSMPADGMGIVTAGTGTDTITATKPATVIIMRAQVTAPAIL